MIDSLIQNMYIFALNKLNKNFFNYYFILFCNHQQTIDQIPTDNVRRNLLEMAKHSCFDEQKRKSLLQVVSLLNNLETMSNDDNDFLFDNESFVSIMVSFCLKMLNAHCQNSEKISKFRNS